MYGNKGQGPLTGLDRFGPATTGPHGIGADLSSQFGGGSPFVDTTWVDRNTGEVHEVREYPALGQTWLGNRRVK